MSVAGKTAHSSASAEDHRGSIRVVGIAQDGMGWLPVLSILAGLVVGVVFVRRQQEPADPLGAELLDAAR